MDPLPFIVIVIDEMADLSALVAEKMLKRCNVSVRWLVLQAFT